MICGSDESRKIVFATMIPGSAAIVSWAVFMQNKSIVEWWKNLKKPKWAPQELCYYGVGDLLTLSPLGYASYLVYKHGGGFDYKDTKLALGMYGANFALMLAYVPLAFKKDLKSCFFMTLAIDTTTIATTVLFHLINKKAGLLLVPLSLWMSYYVALTYSLWQENKGIDSQIKDSGKRF